VTLPAKLTIGHLHQVLERERPKPRETDCPIQDIDSRKLLCRALGASWLRVYDADEIVWVDTLPDDVHYELPFVLEHEEKYPALKSKGESTNTSPIANDPGVAQPQSRRHVEERLATLAALIEEIAIKAKELGIEHDHAQMPGIIEEFRDFVERRDSQLYHRLPTDRDRFNDDLKALGVKFLQGNHKGKGSRFFKNLFPELY
jgi:hypothetical protein